MNIGHQNNQLGYLFEKTLYEKLNDLHIFDKIHFESDLRKICGWDSSGIDLLLVRDDMYIALQAKWRKTRRRENACISKFIKSLQHVHKAVGDKKMILGLWVSRRAPFEDNQHYLETHNIRCIYDFESMTSVANKMVDIVINYLNREALV